MKLRLLKYFLICIVFSGAICAEGYTDPNELLENLSPPIIRYKQIPIKIKPPVSLQQDETNRKINSNSNNKKLVNKSSRTNKVRDKATNESDSLFTNLLDSLGSEIKDISSNVNITEDSKNRIIKDQKQKDIARQTALAKAKLAELEKQIKIKTQQLADEEKKNKEVEKALEAKISKLKSESVATSSIVATSTGKPITETPAVVAKKTVEPVVKKTKTPKEAPPKKVATAFDSLFIKIKALEKKEKWKDISSLLRRNKKAANSKQGLVYQILCALNAKKISYSKIGRFGNQLIKLDKKSSWGNYAVALKYYYGRKQKVDKAIESLGIALKAKKIAPGASKLYWIITLKKYWILLLVFLGAIVGGIDFLIKKKKAKDLENKSDGDNPEEEDEGIDENRPEGFKGKLYDIKKKIQSVIRKAKVKGKKETDPSDDNADEDNDNLASDSDDSDDSNDSE